MVGFLTLLEREIYRFSRLTFQTIVPPAMTTLLFVVIFGYSLGERIQEISGHSYILFILPGLVGMAVVTNSYANSSTSLYMARLDRMIENIMVAPISHFQIVAAFVIGGIIRGLVVGGVTLSVALLLTELKIHSYFLTFLYLVFISVIFSSLGVISANICKGWEQLATFSTFVLTPFVYLGGVFYSVEMLPDFWRQVSQVNPILYFIDGLRYATLGVGDFSPTVTLSVAIVLALCMLVLAVQLFRSGYKLIL